MAGQRPERTFFPITFGGVLDEAQTTTGVGGSGLTACNNLIYRRYGAWGKRAGSTLVYVSKTPSGPPPTPTQPPPFTPKPTNPPNPPSSPPGTPPATPSGTPTRPEK